MFKNSVVLNHRIFIFLIVLLVLTIFQCHITLTEYWEYTLSLQYSHLSHYVAVTTIIKMDVDTF